MLRERRSAASDTVGVDPVFPAVMGGLRDPSNTQADLREIFARAGYRWATSHVYRTTVATLMNGPGSPLASRGPARALDDRDDPGLLLRAHGLLDRRRRRTGRLRKHVDPRDP